MELDNFVKICKHKILMGKLFLFIAFFTLAPLIIILSLVFSAYLSFQKNQILQPYSSAQPIQSAAYAALPTVQNIFWGQINQKDVRVETVRQFFQKYSSPLEPFAQTVITKADFYGLDYRLLPAIAMQESNLCKKAPKDSYNCWGFGIYGKQVKKFESYTHAIDAVTKTLANEYKGRGLETPSEIMKKYTPSNNGSWANSVDYFMNNL